MSLVSFSTKRRCRTCGNSWYAPTGERSRCPYTLMHERSLRAKGSPPANTHPTAVKLRGLAVEFAKYKAAEYCDACDKAGQRLNRKLLAAARAYARAADHAEALLESEK